MTGRRSQQTFNNGDFVVIQVKYVICCFFSSEAAFYLYHLTVKSIFASEWKKSSPQIQNRIFPQGFWVDITRQYPWFCVKGDWIWWSFRCVRFEILCHCRCGTWNTLSCLRAVSTRHTSRLKIFQLDLHQQWWRFLINEIFSKGKNPTQNQSINQIVQRAWWSAKACLVHMKHNHDDMKESFWLTVTSCQLLQPRCCFYGKLRLVHVTPRSAAFS